MPFRRLTWRPRLALERAFLATALRLQLALTRAFIRLICTRIFQPPQRPRSTASDSRSRHNDCSSETPGAEPDTRNWYGRTLEL